SGMPTKLSSLKAAPSWRQALTKHWPTPVVPLPDCLPPSSTANPLVSLTSQKLTLERKDLGMSLNGFRRWTEYRPPTDPLVQPYIFCLACLRWNRLVSLV